MSSTLQVQSPSALTLRGEEVGRGPILATAFSNKGCDNMAANLWDSGVKVVRVGAGTDDSVPYSLDAQARCGDAKLCLKGL